MERRLLLLFARTGRGHEQAALALRGELLDRHADIRVELLDIGELNPLLRPLPQVYSMLMRYFPRLYSLLFKSTNGRRRADFIGRIVARLIRRHLFEVTEDVPTQMVVLHPFFLSTALRELRHRYEMTWIIQVVTLDLANPHAGWWCSGVDEIYVFCEEARSRASELAPSPVPLLVCGFPVGKVPFWAQKPRDSDEKWLVLCAGIVPMSRFLRLLVMAINDSTRRGLRLCVITSGSRAQAWVARRFGGHIEAYTSLDNTDFMGLLQRADRIIAKAGPSLLAEVVQLDVHVDILNEVGDQEQGNALIYNSGRLIASSDRPELVAELLAETPVARAN